MSAPRTMPPARRFSSSTTATGASPVVYEKRQHLAQRRPAPRPSASRRAPRASCPLVALGEPGDLLGLAQADKPPLLVEHEDVGEAGLPHPPQDRPWVLRSCTPPLWVGPSRSRRCGPWRSPRPRRSAPRTRWRARAGSARGCPSCTISPSFMIATRCPSVRASSRSWVTKTTVRFTSPWMERKRFCMSRRIRGSSAEKGSSMRQYLLLRSQGPGEPDALLHAAGELGYKLVALPL